MILDCYAQDYYAACTFGDIPIGNKTMLEFGNELIKNCMGIKGKLSAKDYWTKAGIKEHVSIDINGKNGALPIDLRKDILIEHPEYKNHFDVVTNIGTLEHLEGNLYQGYKNLHNCTKVGGIMIHAGPPIGTAPNHSPNHYRLGFFEELFFQNYYLTHLVQMRIPQDGRNKNLQDNMILFAIAQKVEDHGFMVPTEFDMVFKGDTCIQSVN